MSNLQSGTVLVTAAATKLGPAILRRFAQDRIGHGTVAALRSMRPPTHGMVRCSRRLWLGLRGKLVRDNSDIRIPVAQSAALTALA